jgi:alpha-ribazole phosphatase
MKGIIIQMLELIIVRHGETDSNIKGTYLGWTDVELNDTGLKQAEAVSEKLKSTKFDFIVSSPLKRAKTTAEIINKSHKQEIVYNDSLKERNFGLWDDLTYKEIIEKYPEESEEWAKNWSNYAPPEGESAVEVYEKLMDFIDKLIIEKQEGTILIVTHLGCIRKLIGHLLGMGIDGSWRFRVDNCSITKIMITEKYPVLTLLNG